jgi:hypothetical protein
MLVPLSLRQKWACNDAIPFGFVRIGYHFCEDWDCLLIGPGDEEMKACTCTYYRNRSLSDHLNLDRIGLLHEIMTKACSEDK